MTNRDLNRISFIRLFFCVLGVVFAVRLFYVQVVRHSWYQALAEGKLSALAERQASLRGDILAVDGSDDQEEVLVASNQKKFLVFVEPPRVEEAKRVANALSSKLGLDDNDVSQKIVNTDDLYVPLKHYVPESTVQELKSLNFAGVGFSPEMKRLYPQRESFSTVSGFLGFRGDARAGQYGLEEYYDQTLSGVSLDSLLKSEGNMAESALVTGMSIVVTLNRTVQQKACEVLSRGVESFEAERGSIVVLEPETGFVKALCQSPAYDPNAYNETDQSLFTTRAVSASYEPGSVFKSITMSAAIDSGAVTPSTEYEDMGSVKFGKYTIRNAENKVYGKVSMTQVLEQSINTGVMFAVREMGVATFDRYAKAFGFGKKTGVDIPSEDPGDISSLAKHKDIFSATGSFGQGITVTPLQLARAYSAIANKGLLPRPQIVKYLEASGGERQEVVREKPIQVISSRTADVISAMLASVVNVGHSKGSKIPGYYIAGKTGTAQIANEGKGGYSEDTNHTFAGFFPLSKPRFVIVVVLEKPHRGKYAESTAVPVFKDMAEFLLQYYKIPPDRQK